MKKIFFLVLLLLTIMSLAIFTISNKYKRATCSGESICEKWKCEDGVSGCLNWKAYCDTPKGRKDQLVCPAILPIGKLNTIPLDKKITAKIKCNGIKFEHCGNQYAVIPAAVNQFSSVRLCKTKKKKSAVTILIVDEKNTHLKIFVKNLYAKNTQNIDSYLFPVTKFQKYEFADSQGRRFYPCDPTDMNRVTDIFSQIFQ